MSAPDPRTPAPRAGYNPFYVPTPAARSGAPRITFSRTEVLHILGAVALLTLCFAAIVKCRTLDCGPLERLTPGPVDLAAAFFAVASGFVLHELAHKVVAQRYGHWAEFRAQFVNLLVSLGLVVGTGILFAAPGAVMIQGQVTRRENGLISIVGPGTNFLIAALTWPLSWTSDESAIVPRILGVVALANSLLAVFNLIPFGPLDGRKVLRWNAAAWVGALLAALALFVAVLVYPYGLSV